MITAGAQLLLKIKKLSESAKLPERSYPSDAGLDLYADEDIVILKHTTLVKIGIAIELPYGTVGLILDRGSMGKKGIKVFGGVIDSNYRGELLVGLAKIAGEDGIMKNTHLVHKGDRIAQLVILPILLPIPYEVEELTATDRNTNKLGSTGE